MFHCHVSFRVGVSAAYNVSMQITSLERYPLNRHPSKGPQVLHLQDIFVRLAIVIPHFQGNHFLSCPKNQKRAGKNLHPNVPPIWGSYITNSFPNPFVSIQLSSTVVTSWTCFQTHGPIQKQPRSSRAQRLWVENARPNHCCNTHPGSDPENFLAKNRKVVPTVEPRAMSGGYLNDSWLMSGIFWKENPRSQGFWRKLKHSPVKTWVYHVFLLKRAWWTTLRFCWSIFLLNDAGKLLSKNRSLFLPILFTN